MFCPSQGLELYFLSGSLNYSNSLKTLLMWIQIPWLGCCLPQQDPPRSCSVCVWDRVSVYSPGWPRIHYNSRLPWTCSNLPASALQVLSFQAQATKSGWIDMSALVQLDSSWALIFKETSGVNHHCLLDWTKITMETHLWVCLGEYFQKDLTEEGRHTLTMETCL